MSRLSFDCLGRLSPIELAAPAAAAARPADSFEQHLNQARQTCGGAAAAEQPPQQSPPEPAPQAGDGSSEEENSPAGGPEAAAARNTDPAAPQDDQATAAEPESERDAPAEAASSPAEANQASEDPQATSAPGERDEDNPERAVVGSVQVTAVLPVDLAVPLEAPQVPNRDGGATDEAPPMPHGRDRGGKAAPTGRLPPPEPEPTARPDAQPLGGKHAVSEPTSDDQRVAGAIEALPSDEGAPLQAENAPEAEATPDQAVPARSRLPDESPEDAAASQGAGAQSRRPSGRESSNPPGVEPNAENVAAQPLPIAGRGQAKRAGDAGWKSAAHGESKTEAVKPLAWGSTPATAGEAEANTPTRATPEPLARPAPAESGQGAPGSEQAERVRFVQRVARAFEAVGDRGGSIRLRLHPPELGTLRMEVTLRNGTMTARLEVENPHARTMLLDNLPALRDRLAEQDIKVGRFDVELADRSPGGLAQGPGSRQEPHDPRGHAVPDTRSAREAGTESRWQSAAVSLPGQGGQLDVFI